jgi:hypothetical protein
MATRMNSPLRTIGAIARLAPLYAVVALTTVLAYFGFTGLDLKVEIMPSVSWIVPAILGVLLFFGIIAFFEEKD